MEIQQRISQQRIQHIVDSYLLAGGEATDEATCEHRQFQAYLNDLSRQYTPGLIELALVETLVKSWLTVPMQKGLPFLSLAHERLKQWQAQCTQVAHTEHSPESIGEKVDYQPLTSSLSPAQFSQITGLDAQAPFAALSQPVALSTQPAIE